MEALRQTAIWIFAPIQQEAKHDQEKKSAEQKWKVCWQNPAMFCFFKHQAKIQIFCIVKLILWNIVNLIHLYKKHADLFVTYCQASLSHILTFLPQFTRSTKRIKSGLGKSHTMKIFGFFGSFANWHIEKHKTNFPKKK